MSHQHFRQETRRPPLLLAGTMTLLVGYVVVASYLPQLGLFEGHWQQSLSDLCARSAGCSVATHRTEAAPDRTSLLSVVTVGTAQRWRSGDVERFKVELRRLFAGRQVELRLTALQERTETGGQR